MILKYDSPNKLIIELENPEINKISQYEIPLKENQLYEKFLVLDTNNTTINLPSKQFEKIINDLNATGSNIFIKCYSDGKAEFYVESENGRCIRIESNHEEELEKFIKVESDKEIKIGLNINILKEFSKAHLIAKQVKLSFGENYPLLAEYKIGEFGQVKFYLAPIV